MKKLFAAVLALALAATMTACTDAKKGNTDLNDPTLENNFNISALPSEDANRDDKKEETKTLVVYFSATGSTKAAAERIAELAGADIYEIVPAEPYTAEDIDYTNDDCRANREMNDSTARPLIAGEEADIASYDNILIGYPIWWGTMPKIINTFLDTYDLTGKNVLPFCTSGGSGISKSVDDIKSSEPDANVTNGLRMNGTSDEDVSQWLADNGITE